MKKVISHGLIGNHILLISKRHAFGFILRAVVFIVMTVKTHTQCLIKVLCEERWKGLERKIIINY